MSLFKVREWWQTNCGMDEEFDRKSLCIGNLDNDFRNPNYKIATGSFSGYLRMYFPQRKGARPEDMLLEQHLGFPILQIAFGKFIPNETKYKALAVLHPRKFVVYNVMVKGNDKDNKYYQLQKLYEHTLHRTAFNFVYGQFGGVYDKDHVCVQSVDGCLTFFEQNTFSFNRF